MDLVKQLESRVEECLRVIARAKADLATFQAALQLEKGRRPTRKKYTKRAGKTSADKTPSLPLVPVDNSGQARNKTDMLREFIKAHPGLSKQAVMAFGNKDIPGANLNFGYTAIYKMASRGEIEMREGNVYPLPKLLKYLEETTEAAS